MSEPPVSPAGGPRSAGRSSQVALASLVGAAVSYAVLWVGANQLTKAENSVLLAFLSVLFMAYGVLSGVATETTRTVAAGARDGRASGPPVWVAGAVAAAVTVVLAVGTSPWWQDEVLHRTSPPLVAVLALGAAGYTFHSVVIGSLVGSARWRDSALVLLADAACRLVLVLVVVVLLGSSITLLAIASAGGAAAWLLVVLLVPRVRSALTRRSDAPGRVLARRMSASVLAQAASAVLIVGFPALLAATTSTADFERSAPLLVAISLTRAPVLIPLNAVQGLVVSHLVHAPAVGVRLVARAVAVAAAVTATGAALAWLVGPWLMTTLLRRPDYDVEGWVLAGLTVGACAIAVLTLSGAATQASAEHVWFLGGWAVAAVTSLGVLLLPGSIEARSVASLVAGPAAGLLVHAVGFGRATLRGGRDARIQEAAHGG